MFQHLALIGEPLVTGAARYARITLGNFVILAAMPHQFGLIVERLLAQPTGNSAVG